MRNPRSSAAASRRSTARRGRRSPGGARGAVGDDIARRHAVTGHQYVDVGRAAQGHARRRSTQPMTTIPRPRHVPRPQRRSGPLTRRRASSSSPASRAAARAVSPRRWKKRLGRREPGFAGQPEEMRAGLRARVRKQRTTASLLTACNHDRAQRAHWTRILERAGGGYKVAVWLTTPVDSCVERVLARRAFIRRWPGPAPRRSCGISKKASTRPGDDEVGAIIKLAPTDDCVGRLRRSTLGAMLPGRPAAPYIVFLARGMEFLIRQPPAVLSSAPVTQVNQAASAARRAASRRAA